MRPHRVPAPGEPAFRSLVVVVLVLVFFVMVVLVAMAVVLMNMAVVLVVTGRMRHIHAARMPEPTKSSGGGRRREPGLTQDCLLRCRALSRYAPGDEPYSRRNALDSEALLASPVRLAIASMLRGRDRGL